MSTELCSILVKAGKITQEQADEAADQVKQNKQKLSAVLVQMGALGSEQEFSEFLKLQREQLQVLRELSAVIKRVD